MDAIEMRARELLAAEFRKEDQFEYAHHVAVGGDIEDEGDQAALRAIIAALMPPEGYVLVPAEPTEGMVLAAKLFQGDHDNVDNWLEWEGVAAANQYRAMLAARPEVKP